MLTVFPGSFILTMHSFNVPIGFQDPTFIWQYKMNRFIIYYSLKHDTLHASLLAIITHNTVNLLLSHARYCNIYLLELK